MRVLTRLAVLCAAASSASAHKTWWDGWADHEDVLHWKKKAGDFKKKVFENDFDFTKKFYSGLEDLGLHSSDDKCKRKLAHAEDALRHAEGNLKKSERARSKCEKSLRTTAAGDGSGDAEARARCESHLARAASERADLRERLAEQKQTLQELRQQLQTDKDARALLAQRIKEETATCGQASQDIQEERDKVEQLELMKDELKSQLDEERGHRDRQCSEVASKQAAHCDVRLRQSAHALEVEKKQLASELAKAQQANGRLAYELDLGCAKAAEGGRGGVAQRFTVAVLALTLVILVVAWRAAKLQEQVSELESQLAEAKTTASERGSEAAKLREELSEELGDVIKVGERGGDLASEFSYHIFDEHSDQEIVRSIKVQCPGVRHGDVRVELIFNGCVVTIAREASPGVAAATWTRRFRFRRSEGLFEFKEDQAALERGFLQLVFRAFAPQSRVFRFPQHFDLDGSDLDCAWTTEEAIPEQHPGNGSMPPPLPTVKELVQEAEAADSDEHAEEVKRPAAADEEELSSESSAGPKDEEEEEEDEEAAEEAKAAGEEGQGQEAEGAGQEAGSAGEEAGGAAEAAEADDGASDGSEAESKSNSSSVGSEVVTESASEGGSSSRRGSRRGAPRSEGGGSEATSLGFEKISKEDEEEGGSIAAGFEKVDEGF